MIEQIIEQTTQREITDQQIFNAAKTGDIEKLDTLLTFNKQFDIKQLKDQEGSTPLHEAARNWHLSVVKRLIEYGAEVNAKDQSGSTPLHRAVAPRKTCYEENLQLVQSLVQGGADWNLEDNSQITPLQAAARLGQINVVQFLLEEDHKRVKTLQLASVASSFYFIQRNNYSLAWIKQFLGFSILYDLLPTLFCVPCFICISKVSR